METLVLEEKVEEIVADEIFVLVLVPKLPAFNGIVKPYEELSICGRSLENWIDDAVAGYPSKRVAVSEKNDILSLVRENSGDYKYVMVLYADTPLLKPATVESAVSFIKLFNNMACRLPRGWVFNSEYIRANDKIEAVTIPDLPAEDFFAVYNYSRLAGAEKMMRARINEEHLENGVYIVDPSTAYIDADVQIERGVVIEPDVTIQGRTIIKQGTRIGKGCTISSCTINASQLVGAEVSSGSVVGPFAHLREGTRIGENCRIGNFVEVKNSIIGDNTKIAHLSYVGDAVVGKNCNIGCGVVFCNYDGKQKHKTEVGDNVFIGSNVNLVAPIKLENDAFIAAGSTITKDVPTETVAIARVKEETHKPRKPKLELIIDDEPEIEINITPEPKIEVEATPEPEIEIKVISEPCPIIEEEITTAIEDILASDIELEIVEDVPEPQVEEIPEPIVEETPEQPETEDIPEPTPAPAPVSEPEIEPEVEHALESVEEVEIEDDDEVESEDEIEYEFETGIETESEEIVDVEEVVTEIEINDAETVETTSEITVAGVTVKTEVTVVDELPEAEAELVAEKEAAPKVKSVPKAKTEIKVVETTPEPEPILDPEEETEEEEEHDPYQTNDEDDEEGSDFTEIALDSTVKFDWDNHGDDLDSFYQGRE